jgi:thioredoxin 1
MIQLNQEQLNKAMVTEGKKLIVFSAEWCGPCKVLKPNLENAEETLIGKIEIIKADISENEESTKEFEIRNIPTCVLVENGKEIARFHGVKTTEDIKKFLEEHTN